MESEGDRINNCILGGVKVSKQIRLPMQGLALMHHELKELFLCRDKSRKVPAAESEASERLSHIRNSQDCCFCKEA